MNKDPTPHPHNTRLETFCDGVYAIAITLLILEINIPHIGEIHSIRASGTSWR